MGNVLICRGQSFRLIRCSKGCGAAAAAGVQEKSFHSGRAVQQFNIQKIRNGTGRAVVDECVWADVGMTAVKEDACLGSRQRLRPHIFR